MCIVHCCVFIPDFSVFARSLPHFLSGFMSAISLAILLKVLETGSAYSCITYSSKRSTLTTFVLPLEKYLVFVRQYYRGYELGYAHIRTDSNQAQLVLDCMLTFTTALEHFR